MEPVPAADLDRAQLGMLKRLPADVRLATELLLAPPEELEVVFDRVIAEPVDVEVLLDARFAHRAPDLDHPAEHAEVIVDPVERPTDDLLGVIAELVVDRDCGVARQLGALRADALVVPQ